MFQSLQTRGSYKFSLTAREQLEIGKFALEMGEYQRGYKLLTQAYKNASGTGESEIQQEADGILFACENSRDAFGPYSP